MRITPGRRAQAHPASRPPGGRHDAPDGAPRAPRESPRKREDRPVAGRSLACGVPLRRPGKFVLSERCPTDRSVTSPPASDLRVILWGDGGGRFGVIKGGRKGI